MAPEVDVRDVLVSAQTGSGKTVAFGLALAKTLLGEAERFTAGGAPRALIVTPTRELAMQVHRELSWLYAETGARITTCVGGMDPRREGHELSKGVHIVVGTPGRLCDHLSRGSLVLDRLAAVVLDEADEMLDMGFREDLERLLEAAPAERRTLMFSATIAPPIATLAKRFQRNALRVATASEGDRHRDISYEVVSVVPRERDLAVVNLLRYHDAQGALVFCGTRDGVAHLAANLSERGFSVAALSGELSQRERNQALQALRDGRARVCVATDVAARGLDLPDLGLVIHADLPQNKETMVHRSGRTGRAGKKGLAILIAVDAARRFVERLLWSARVEAQWRLPPSSDDIRARDQQQLAGEIEGLTGEVSDADRDVARALLTERSAEDLVAALVRTRREARPSPEELTVPMSMRQRGPGGPGPADRRDDRDRPRYDRVVRGRDERTSRVGERPDPSDRRPQRANEGYGDRKPANDYRRPDDGPAADSRPAPNGARSAPASRPARMEPSAAPADRPARTEPSAAPADRPARTEQSAAAADRPARTEPSAAPAARTEQSAAAADRPARTEPSDRPARMEPSAAPADRPARMEPSAAPADRPARMEPSANGPESTASSADRPARTETSPSPSSADRTEHASNAEHVASPSSERASSAEHVASQPSERASNAEHMASPSSESSSAERAVGSSPEPTEPGESTAAADSSNGTHTERPSNGKRAASSSNGDRQERREARAKRPEPRVERAASPERPQSAVESDLIELLGVPRDSRKLVWFTINIGRSKNADPKWLVPLLCRRGGISKNAIGKIQIFARETRVEISHDVSERFAAAVREPDTQDRNIHIEPVDVLAI